MSHASAKPPLNQPLAASAVLALLLACGGLPFTARAGGPAALEMTEIAPGIHVHSGRHVSIDDPARADIANIGFIIGDRCVAVVDSGGSIAQGEALLEAVRTRTTLPVCHVINTHGHFDHVLGNRAFRDVQGVSFTGHAGLAASLAASTELFLRQFSAELGPGATADDIIVPTLPVPDRHEIDLGNRILELQAWPAAHTDADLTVLDRNTGTLWTGDLVFMDRIPVLDGSLRGWLDVLARLRALDLQRIVPGHGPASAPWPEAQSAQAAYLGALRDDVRAGIAAGQFLEDLVDSAAREPARAWLLYTEHHGRNVSRAFTELEWE